MKDRWGTERLEAFSDGVFAIAITLLVLDIRVPLTEFDDLWAAIFDAWPQYLAYATSFITIGGLWMAHHGIFRRLEYANARVMRLNLLLLMAVAFLPFPTRLMAEAISLADAERAAVVFYGANLLVISGLLSALWSTALSDRSLLKPDVDEEEMTAILRRTAPSWAFYVGVIVLARFAPQVAAVGFLVIAVVAVLRVHGTENTSATASSSP